MISTAPFLGLTSQRAGPTVRHFAWRHVRCASKYATITIFKGICQFILMAAIKVNYSRRQNVQRRRRRRRRWRQGYSLVPAQKCREGRAEPSSEYDCGPAMLRCLAGSAQLGIIRSTCPAWVGHCIYVCVCVCVCGCGPCLIFLMILLQLTLFEFDSDCRK